eukprot:SM000003S11140  [mRNA]  locus=s3:1213582:1213875:+ [translate_table: standard]
MSSRAARGLAPLQQLAVLAGFSALSGYGFMFGKEAARRELEAKIRELKDRVAGLSSSASP